METNIWTSVLPFGRMSLRTGAAGPSRLHVHAETSLIVRLDGPALRMCVPDRERLLDPGEMMLIRPWQLHKLATAGNDGSTLTILLNTDRIATGSSLVRDALCSDSLVVPLAPEQRSTAELLAEGMMDAGERMLDTAETSVLHLLHASTELRSAGSDGFDRSPAVACLDARVRSAVDYMLSRPTKALDANVLAETVGLSRSQLFRSFKSSLGCPPRYVADSARVRFAVSALAHTEDDVSSIADDLGFSLPCHFSRFFLEHMGVSPSTYRGRLRTLG